ncbi:MAG TPA: hypothetical protein VM345_00525 [Acidimicrobiales bacterium]|jgi:hypothetical protein|nr:hypothetical protein [Acidimicrobiales bacterium]
MTNTTSTTTSGSTSAKTKRVRLVAAGVLGAGAIIVGSTLIGGSDSTPAPAPKPVTAAAPTAKATAARTDRDESNTSCRGGRAQLPAAPSGWNRAPLRVYGDTYTAAVPDGWHVSDEGSAVSSQFVLKPYDYTDIAITIGSLPAGFGAVAVDLFLEDYLNDAGLTGARLATAEQVTFAGVNGCRLAGSIDGRYIEIVYAVTEYRELIVAAVAAEDGVDQHYITQARAVIGSINKAQV